MQPTERKRIKFADWHWQWMVSFVALTAMLLSSLSSSFFSCVAAHKLNHQRHSVAASSNIVFVFSQSTTYFFFRPPLSVQIHLQHSSHARNSPARLTEDAQSFRVEVLFSEPPSTTATYFLAWIEKSKSAGVGQANIAVRLRPSWITTTPATSGPMWRLFLLRWFLK